MLAALLLPVALTAHQGADVSGGEPVKEVLLLLSRIQASIEREGQEEAAAYDKFACFCKEEADGKQYAIDKALAKESILESHMAVDGADKETLDAEVETLSEEISTLQSDMADADSTRADEHWTYGNRSAQIEHGIKAIEKAISQTKPGFLQTKGLRGKQEPNVVYKEQSAEVVKAFEDLRDDFRAERDQANKDEAAALAEHTKVELARQRQVDAKTASAFEKNATSASLAAAVGEDGTDKNDEKTAREADQAFLADLTVKCEAKAQAWDARSTVRAGELKALALATEALSPAIKTYGATDDVGRKLGVSLGQGIRHHGIHKHAHRHAHRHAHAHAHVRRARAIAASFIQLDTKHEGELRERLAETLQGNAHFAEVGAAVNRGDAFADVKGMLTQLVADLRQEALDAQAEAEWCETEMTRATSSRDATVAALAKYAALSDRKSTERDSLTEDISGLSFEVANLTKALSEETELRSQESKFNAKRVTDSKAGLEAVQDAINILETYYQSVGTPVEPEPVVSEDPTDSSGNSFDSAAPDTGFSNDGYAGNQNSGSFVVAELEKIETTFDSTVTDVAAEEADAVSDFTTLKDDMDADIAAKTALIASKNGEKTAAVTTIEDAATDTTDGKSLLAQTLHEIENLKPACIATLSGADARTAARNQEIQVLNQAMGILEDGLSFGNQTAL